MAYKIIYGRNTTKLTDEQYKQRIYDAHKGNIEVLSEYKNNRTLVRYKCLKHNFEWDGRPSMVMSGSTSCPDCQHDRRIEFLSDTLDSLKEKIFNKWGNEYEILDSEYIDHNHKMTFKHNLKNGTSHIVYSYPGRILCENSGCPVCSGMQISKGYNDIATTDPEIASWFLNKDETYIYSKSSNKKVDFKCPVCGHISNKLINQVSRVRDIRWVFWEDYIKMTDNEIEQIKNSEKSRIKRIVCLNTKVVFNSATIAGQWCGVGKNAIRRSALKERASGGKHPETGEKLQWIYYEDYIKEFDKSTLTPYRVGA